MPVKIVCYRIRKRKNPKVVEVLIDARNHLADAPRPGLPLPRGSCHGDFATPANDWGHDPNKNTYRFKKISPKSTKATKVIK